MPLRLLWLSYEKYRFFFFIKIFFFMRIFFFMYHMNHGQNNVDRTSSPENWSCKKVLADQHPRRADTKPLKSVTDSRKFADALGRTMKRFLSMSNEAKNCWPPPSPRRRLIGRSYLHRSNPSYDFPIPRSLSSPLPSLTETISSCKPSSRWHGLIHRLIK